MKGTLILTLASVQLSSLFAAVNLPEFDFTQSATCAEWRAVHDIASLRPTPEGLAVAISGMDPYFHGPARDYPADLPLWLNLRVKSEEGGAGQVFYFRDHPREENSVRFHAKADQWTTARLPVPPLGSGYRLRIDPPGTRGQAVISSLRFESRAPLAAPTWPAPQPLDLSKAARLPSGSLEVLVTDRGFAVNVEGRKMAASHTHSLIGYLQGDKVRWLDLTSLGLQPTRVDQTPLYIRTFSELGDRDGAIWRITQTFSRSSVTGTIDLEVEVEADRERSVVFLPLALLVAGQDAFGTNKNQALFSGLEYLANEPSSSEADLIGPEAKRQVPANHKITFPLMAIQAEDRYVGLVWDHSSRLSALFDSPDRTLGTGAQVMGVLFPGSDGFNRTEGSILPTRGEILRANEPIVLRAQLIGGKGGSVVPAIQHYVRLRGLPAAPDTERPLPNYVTLAAHGWLDSRIREGNLYRHAVWGDAFGPHGAADAALYMNWLAGHTEDDRLRRRLKDAEEGALSAVPPARRDFALVGHVRYPVQALVYGEVATVAEQHRAQARGLLGRLNADGTVTYHARPDSVDYGRTHFANHANGLSAQVLSTLMESAMFSGDETLITQALEKLRALQRTYRQTVPRGAQTWEVPLHTPDIMASAHLVRAFTMGHELTGEQTFLDEAFYWAWTGLPFLYLISPVGFSDPAYGCVTVYGATGWKAPVWFGRPVQWCGLVYADALYRLAPLDPSGPWKQIADGITAMGVRYTWPLTDKERQGLLPDVWEMLQQERAGPAINPGTVQANAVRLYGQPPLYDCRAVRSGSRRFTVHAPGAITVAEASGRRLKFTVRGWPKEPYYALINGLNAAPQLIINGKPVPLGDPHQFQEKERRLILRLSGEAAVQLGL